jgi:hypothetical protein
MFGLPFEWLANLFHVVGLLDPQNPPRKRAVFARENSVDQRTVRSVSLKKQHQCQRRKKNGRQYPAKPRAARLQSVGLEQVPNTCKYYCHVANEKSNQPEFH